MMIRKLGIALMTVILSTASLHAQFYTIDMDTQTPEAQHIIPQAFEGNTPYLRSRHYENGTPITLSNIWSMIFWYSKSSSSTQGVSITGSWADSNLCQYVGATNVFYQAGDYYFAVRGIHTSGYVKTFGRGKMYMDYDPAADTNLQGLISAINVTWWTNNLGLTVFSNEAAIAVLETGKVDYATFWASNLVFETYDASVAAGSNLWNVASSNAISATNRCTIIEAATNAFDGGTFNGFNITNLNLTNVVGLLPTNSVPDFVATNSGTYNLYVTNMDLQAVADYGSDATNVLGAGGIKLNSSTVTNWGTSGTLKDGSTVSRGLITELGGGALTNVLDELKVADITSLGSELILNGVFTNNNHWSLTGCSRLTSGSYSNMIIINAGATGVITPSNAISITAGYTYYTTFDVIGFGDSFTNQIVMGRYTNTVAATNSTAVNRVHPVYATNNIVLTVDNPNTNYAVYIDNLSVKQVTDGDAWIADDLYVAGAANFSGTINATNMQENGTNILARTTANMNTNVTQNARIGTNEIASTTVVARSNTWDQAVLDSTNAAAMSTGYVPAARYAPCSNLWYVGECGTSTNSGRSIYDAVTNIQAAIDLAHASEAAGNGHQAVMIGGGDWVEDIEVRKGVSIHGSGRRVTRITGTTTVSNDYTGGVISDLSLRGEGSISERLIVQAGMDASKKVRIQNIGIVAKNLTAFTAPMIRLNDGHVILYNVGFRADNPSFIAMSEGSSRLLVSTNNAEIDINNMQVFVENLNSTNVNITLFELWSTNEFVVKNSVIEMTMTNINDAHTHYLLDMRAGAGDYAVENCRIKFTTASTNNDLYVAGVRSSGGGTLRVTDGSITIEVDGENSGEYWGSLTNASTIAIHGGCDVRANDLYDDQGGDNTVSPSYSPADGNMTVNTLTLGSETRSDFPKSQRPAAGTSIAYLDSGVNALVTIATGYGNIDVVNGTASDLTDTDDYNTGIEVTFSDFRQVHEHGVTNIFNVEQNTTLDSMQTYKAATAYVMLTNLVNGTEYTVEFYSAHGTEHGTIAPQYTRITAPDAETRDIQFVTNVNNFAVFTNTAGATKALVYEITTPGNYYGYINGLEITHEADPGYLRTDGENAMGADLNAGGYQGTNFTALVVSETNVMDMMVSLMATGGIHSLQWDAFDISNAVWAIDGDGVTVSRDFNVSSNLDVTGYTVFNSAFTNLGTFYTRGAAIVDGWDKAATNTVIGGEADAAVLALIADQGDNGADTGLIIMQDAALGNAMEFYTGGTYAMTMSGGRVGVGTNQMVAVLEIMNSGGGKTFKVHDSYNDSTPFIVDEAGKVGIETLVPQRTLHVGGEIAMTSQTNAPAAIADSGQLYTVTNEVYAMDSAGNETILTPHPEWAGNEAVIIIEANVYDDEITYILKSDLVGVMTGTITPNPSLLKTAIRPAHMKRDWDTDEQAAKDKSQAEIDRWDAEPVHETPRPKLYKKRKRRK